MQAERYFAGMKSETVLPGRLHVGLGIGAWLVGACEYLLGLVEAASSVVA
jgi:hypothetical protein